MQPHPNSTSAVMDIPAEAVQLPAREFVRGAGVTKTFRSGEQQITPLDGIDFTILRGEMIAIVGPSGAGKSTFLHALAALDTLTSGALYFESRLLQSFNESELAE